MTRARRAAAALFCTALAGAAAAADYPNRPVRLVVGFPAGGTPDVIARVIAGQVERQLGQSIVVDNRAGANGIIGYEIVARAAPDGYTLLHTTPAIVTNLTSFRALPYDIRRDYAPVTVICMSDGYLLLAHPSFPATSVRELIALAKNRDKPVTYGSPGVGSVQQLVAELFNVRAGVALMNVPYKGVAPALNALIAGEVQTMFLPPTVAVPQVRAGKVRALGFSGAKRWSVMPEVPTLIESGVPGFDVAGAWQAWFAPARTPPALLERLQREIGRAVEVPKVRDFLAEGGWRPVLSRPGEVRAFLDAEIARYAEMAKAAGIKPE